MGKEYKVPKIEKIEFEDIIMTSEKTWVDGVDTVGYFDVSEWSLDF